MSWTVRGSNPGRGKRFLSSPKSSDLLWGTLSLLFKEYLGPFPGVRQVEREVDHSSPSSAEVKNNGTSIIYSNGVRRGFTSCLVRICARTLALVTEGFLPGSLQHSTLKRAMASVIPHFSRKILHCHSTYFILLH